MEAAGVELLNLLILRKLLVLQEATSAKKGSLPGRRYKNGTDLILDAILPFDATFGKNWQHAITAH